MLFLGSERMNPLWKTDVDNFKDAFRNASGGYAPWENSLGGCAIHPFTKRIFHWARNRRTGELIWSRKSGGIGRREVQRTS